MSIYLETPKTQPRCGIETEKDPTKARHFKDILRETGTFFYETPAWVIVSAIAGAAFAVIYAPLAYPFLGAAAGAFLARATIKILDIAYPEKMKSFKKDVLEFQKKLSWLHFVAFSIAVAVSFLFPIAGLAASLCVGAYKGLVTQVEETKFKQHKHARFHPGHSQSFTPQFVEV